MRRRAFPLVLAAALTLARSAAAQDCLPLTPRDAEGTHVLPGTLAAVVYRQLGDRSLALDAYAQRGSGPRPLVVVVHGGGGATGSRVSFVGQFLETLTEAGFAWASIDYRLGAPTEAQVDDVVAAVAFLRCHAGPLRADPERVVLLGEDSGGALVLHAALPARASGVISVGGSRTAVPPAGDVPPMLLIHGSEDRESPLAAMADACEARRRAGGRCTLLPVAGASHRAENWWPRHWSYKRRLVEWLEHQTGPPGPHRPYDTSLRKRVVYDATERLTLDVWTPGGPGPHPVVLLAHGGGWEAGDRVTYLTPLIAPLAKAGFAWVSIDYRLTPQVLHAAQLDDLRRAIGWVRLHGRAHRLDPGRLVIAGESASGQMVMQVAAREPGLRGVVSFYGVYDFAPLVTDASPRSLLARLFGRRVLDDEARAVMRRYSPLHHVRGGMPPVLLIHGTNERLWDQGVAMAAALGRAGVAHELVRLEGAPHGMENWEGHPEWTAYKDRLVAWLREQFDLGRSSRR